MSAAPDWQTPGAPLWEAPLLHCKNAQETKPEEMVVLGAIFGYTMYNSAESDGMNEKKERAIREYKLERSQFRGLCR